MNALPNPVSVPEQPGRLLLVDDASERDGALRRDLHRPYPWHRFLGWVGDLFDNCPIDRQAP